MQQFSAHCIIWNLDSLPCCLASVWFSPYGKRIVSGRRDETVKLWDALTGEELETFYGHSTWIDMLLGHSKLVKAVEFCPDGRWVVSVAWVKLAGLFLQLVCEPDFHSAIPDVSI